jgi:LacI family transcriptional regulator
MKKLTVGIEVVPSIAFGRAFVEGVSRYAIEQKNWRLVALQQETLSLETLRRCDGVILRVFDDRTEQMIQRAGIAAVDVFCSKSRAGIAQVTTDEETAGRMAANFFLGRGFKNFACCGVNGYPYSDICIGAFIQTVREGGFEVSQYECPPHLRGKDIMDNGSPYHAPDATTIRKWLRQLPKPVAVFCCNDHRAYQVMDTALKHGIDIPTEVAIMGCDNDTMLCTFAPVPISSIDSDAIGLGYAAARVLNAILKEPPKQRRHHKAFLLPPRSIVERESSEFAPVGIPWLSDAILLIEKNLSSGISAEDIFKMSGYSPPYVEKVFKERFGSTVQTYITKARMKKATALLHEGTLSTKEIAAACGYASPQYFCRAFKSHFGVSPQKHMKQPHKS